MKAVETCPIPDLDEFALEHWDRDTLCGHFAREACMATLEDLGYPGEEDSDDDAVTDWEIPF